LEQLEPTNNDLKVATQTYYSCFQGSSAPTQWTDDKVGVILELSAQECPWLVLILADSNRTLPPPQRIANGSRVRSLKYALEGLHCPTSASPPGPCREEGRVLGGSQVRSLNYALEGLYCPISASPTGPCREEGRVLGL